MKINGVWNWKDGYSAYYDYWQPEILPEIGFPQIVGNVLVGLKSWYKNEPLEIIKTEDGDEQTYCCMRGSKRGIRIASGEKLVHAYSYYMQQKIANRLYKRFKRTGNRTFIVKSRSDRARLAGSKKEPYLDFKHELINNFYEDSGKYDDRIVVHNSHVAYEVYGDFAVFIGLGLTHEQYDSAFSIFRHVAESLDAELSKEKGKLIKLWGH